MNTYWKSMGWLLLGVSLAALETWGADSVVTTAPDQGGLKLV
jgi:hypothetical protein